MIELPVILDLTVIFLLIVAIVYGVRLSRRISIIQRSRNELATLFRAFDETIVKAQESVEHLKEASSYASNGLQKQIDKAAILVDDLEFMEEKSRAACDLLNEMLKSASPTLAHAQDVVERRSAFYSAGGDTGKPSPEIIKKMRSQRRAEASSASSALSPLLSKKNEEGSSTSSAPSSDMELRAQNLESAIHRIAAGRHHAAEDVNVVPSSGKKRDDVAKALKSLGYGS